MRYKKKHILLIFAFGCSVCYLGLFHDGQTVNGVVSYDKNVKDSPDVFRYKINVEPGNKQASQAPPSDFVVAINDSIINSSLITAEWLSTYLPHLKDSTYVQPRIKWSQGRTNASVVIGIPTIKRPTEDSYLLDTIQSFFDGMTDQERSDVIMVVSITEPWNLGFESTMLNNIKERFPAQLEEGALEVIAPHPEFYPDLNKIKQSLGDSKSRVKWRSKQNLDYGFLMMHCIGKAAYYLQMEDDISTVKGWVTSIKKTVAKQKSKQWLSLCFSQLGYIGRLYKIGSVRGIMEYLLKNFDKKPCDWLQYDYLRQLLCPPKQPRKLCNTLIGKYTWLIKPTLFQHKGFRSSFQGNINKLQDKYFAQGKSLGLYSNPKCTALLTSLQVHGSHTLNAAYYTKGFFWGKHPKRDDTIEFLFQPPIAVARIAMISGQVKHANDIITNATVEIMPSSAPATNSSLISFKTVPLRSSPESHQHPLTAEVEKRRKAAIPMLNRTTTDSTKQQFYIVGHFKAGSAEVKLPKDIGTISIIRVRFEKQLDHWIILDQILVL